MDISSRKLSIDTFPTVWGHVVNISFGLVKGIMKVNKKLFVHYFSDVLFCWVVISPEVSLCFVHTINIYYLFIILKISCLISNNYTPPLALL